jgi:hypothetical protein
MKKNAGIIFLLLLLIIFPAYCHPQDSLIFKGQASAWINYNGGNKLPLYSGLRYIPQLNSAFTLQNDKKIDFEISANINGNAGLNPFDSLRASGQIKPYRAWVRYSSQQFELRAGLQKLNFGSASLLRPLMWFDQIDPRDPLKLTAGVWGLLGRYYFLNNANIWLWGLYGNTKPRGWEPVGTNSRYPEAGGRIQIPVPTGEAAITYNYRIADTRDLNAAIPEFSRVHENKLGFDIKLDMVVGLWFEGSWTNKNRDLGLFTNQEILNLGADYTFNTGNGLYVIFEQLLASYDKKPFNFQNTTTFSLLSVSYPVSIFDNITGIVYFDWNSKKSYNFLNWQKQFDNITLYFMGYWNPVQYNIPAQGLGENLFAGKGVQVMLVFNH